MPGKITNTQCLSESWMRAAERDLYSNPADWSITQLGQPVRKVLLEQRHDLEIIVDLTDLVHMLSGSAMHALLEWGRCPEDIIEKRYIMEVNGQTVGYKPDCLHPVGNNCYHLYEYKRCGIFSVKNGVTREWLWQTNMYRFGLMEFEKLSVPYVTIECLLKDWSLGEQQRSGDSYPSSPIIPLTVSDLWPPQNARKQLEERINLFMQAKDLPDDELPQCTDEERWLRDRKFGVKKPANKKATKSFDTKSEAEAFRRQQKKPGDYDIIETPGKYVRCDDWCWARPFCNQCEPEKKPRMTAPPPASTPITFVNNTEEF